MKLRLKKRIFRIGEIWASQGAFRKRWFYFVLLALTTAILEGIGIGLVIPILELLVSDSDTTFIQRYIPESFQAVSREKLGLLALGVLLVLVIAKSIFMIYKSAFSIGLVNDLRNKWREQIISELFFSFGQAHESKRQGELFDTIVLQTTGASKFILCLSQIITQSIFAIVMLIIVMTISWQITMILLCVFIAFSVAINSPIRYWSKLLGSQSLKISQRIGAAFSEILQGIREIRILSLEDKKMDSIVLLNSEDLAVIKKSVILREIIPARNQILVVSLIFCGGIFVAYFSETNFIEILPFLVVFVIVAQKLSVLASSMMNYYVIARGKYPAFCHVTDFLKQRDLSDSQKVREIDNFKSQISFENVTFRYAGGETTVLRDFNMVIPRGKIVALVGQSGSGKSTLADLLLRLREPEGGKISIDGVDVKEFDVFSWRRSIGYVSQNSFLFNMSIIDNIRLGRHNATRQEVEDAAHAANAHNFIRDLPNGYDTQVGDAGSLLSGGQRQRIVLAQAILREPMLFVLDEPTSALDIESTRLIYRTIHNLAEKGHTVLLITHDAKMTENADVTVNLKSTMANDLRTS